MPKSLQTAKLALGHTRTCDCPANHISCITAKEWVKAQVTIQRFFYEGRDVRDKDVHPAVYPIALPAHFIKTLTHAGELVLDPFGGIGTTLLAAKDLARNAVSFDLKKEYVDYATSRLLQSTLTGQTQQVEICDDALNIPNYLEPGSRLPPAICR